MHSQFWRRRVRCRSHDPSRLPIIFWFPRTCHLSERLHSSSGRTPCPDCQDKKAAVTSGFAAASRSLR
ncbi:Hypothetical predicted protein [Xyrichtys novacula]|uniref:Uncharacterized protein n=1 Tax=Xyrichtys novacula TaxID=13765 RepID=A0AAV1HR53_XYRNO|nr:Hypothetical predicted protein [Xyrichtys novacula]